MIEVHANAVPFTVVYDSSQNIDWSMSFPNCYLVEKYTGDDNFGRLRVFETEQEYIWYKLKS
jgi:hypothetical protein